MSVKFVSAILGPERAAAILWTPGKMRSLCRKNHVHKIPRFFLGGYLGFFGGGNADFIFMGARIFSENGNRKGVITKGIFSLEERTLSSLESLAHLFSRTRKKGFSSFFLWGDPVQNRPQNPAPGGSLFSARKSRSEVPERQDFGEENWLGKGGVDRGKKRKKGCAKKGGLENDQFLFCFPHSGISLKSLDSLKKATESLD